MKNSVVIGISGGSGSGKTTVAENLVKQIGDEHILLIKQDYYYKDNSHLPLEERAKLNYDCPDAFDTELLIEHIKQLVAGKAIDQPQYDFTVHNRKPERIRVEPKRIILLEGILVLHDAELRDLMDIKVFVDADSDIRLLRRVLRDTRERGRTLDSIAEQYLKTVRPMYEKYIHPTKKYADIIVPKGGFNQVAIDILVARIKSYLMELEKVDG
ncbi:uridine kinase [Anoxybacter fermentans]|uniref:Uridine kinase n=1 Tax=Anoxybacter fermentans TaxID=1323375 RepID=A0A3S9SZY2_9FIRM|nr:uridine kinase [Anoxybacter fermentans]AZR73906.1 uridine kinase [Anoxybacter fermentans]